jgi:hypothetical protein
MSYEISNLGPGPCSQIVVSLFYIYIYIYIYIFNVTIPCFSWSKP